MKFENSFDVEVPPAEAWAILTDVERVAPCMPGAELTEVVDDRNFKGNVSVRLGPVALTFSGAAAFEELDDEARSARVRAQGRDAKGRGGANADVRFRLIASGESATTVEISTDLQLSGAVAQYGRGVGMIKEVAAQLIGQFAEALHERIAADRAQAPAPAAPRPISGLALLWAALLRRLKRLAGAKKDR